MAACAPWRRARVPSDLTVHPLDPRSGFGRGGRFFVGVTRRPSAQPAPRATSAGARRWPHQHRETISMCDRRSRCRHAARSPDRTVDHGRLSTRCGDSNTGWLPRCFARIADGDGDVHVRRALGGLHAQSVAHQECAFGEEHAQKRNATRNRCATLADM